ncbi:radical SAM protein [Lentisphaerota bacterium ZTH]|nr:radical SAM protein [Lentisphaerota bacterium]WET05585.1 radical SAM protein [Lentisphaerota bacterium ZTH]
MIGISKLYCGTSETADNIRYQHGAANHAERKPVVVWNCTPECNLSCSHCYSASGSAADDYEMTTAEGRLLIEQLADFGSPVILFSGGEPLLRKDLPELARYAVEKGMHAVISSNGTLIDSDIAGSLKAAGVTYVGVSIDGLEDTHDRFRQRNGAFLEALWGIRACRNAGLKVGLRCTLNKENIQEIPGIFELMIRENIPRICFYHLVSTGRGKNIKNSMLSSEATRRAVDMIIDYTAGLHKAGRRIEVLTVDNLADGPYLYLRMLRENHPRAAAALQLLKRTAGGSTGVGIGCVNWNGEVYPDQFWRNKKLGNILIRPFGDIWTDLSNPLMKKLKNKQEYVTGRCAECRLLKLCCGNFRARAEALTGDPWAADPGCYLNDEEIFSI